MLFLTHIFNILLDINLICTVANKGIYLVNSANELQQMLTLLEKN